jgi:hypothetical protein
MGTWVLISESWYKSSASNLKKAYGFGRGGPCRLACHVDPPRNVRASAAFSIASAPATSHVIRPRKVAVNKTALRALTMLDPTTGTARTAYPTETWYQPEPLDLTQDEIREIVLNTIG